MPIARDLAPGEWSLLALLAEEPGHGWALAKKMARTGEIGRVWTVGRPLVYRALELLEDRGLIEAVGSEPGARGPNRTLFAATGEGLQALRRWLLEPVDHVRDVRSLFLLKLVLIERAGLDSRALLQAQRALTVPVVEALEARLRHSTGTESVFVRFRLETTRAVIDFIDSMLAESPPPGVAGAAGTGAAAAGAVTPIAPTAAAPTVTASPVARSTASRSPVTRSPVARSPGRPALPGTG